MLARLQTWAVWCASEVSIDQMPKRSALCFCLDVEPQGTYNNVTITIGLSRQQARGRMATSQVVVWPNVINCIYITNHSLSIKFSEKIYSQISMFAEGWGFVFTYICKRSPRKRKYWKSRNEEHVGRYRQVRKKGNIHKKKREEPQTLRVGHELVGGWMWHTNDDVGGGGYMRDVCARCRCKGIKIWIWIWMMGWDCRWWMMTSNLEKRVGLVFCELERGCCPPWKTIEPKREMEIERNW